MPESLLSDWRPRLIAMASSLMKDDGAHDIQHLHRVWKTASQLLQQTPAMHSADALTVQAACYLHDIVNLPKNHPERHLASRMAAQRARIMLAGTGFPESKLDLVCHAIEAHSFSAGIEPRTIEAMIVQDADRLDALGAVGLSRMFYIAGRMGSMLAHPHDPMARSRPLDDRAYALDHIEAKLATLPSTMRTEAGRRLGEERLAWLRRFREDFVVEWGVGL